MRFAALCLSVLAAATAAGAGPEEEFARLRDEYLARYRPAFLRMTAAHWDAMTTGAEEALERQKQAERALVDVHSDRALFGRIQALKEADSLTDAVCRRELDELYRRCLPHQVDPELSKRIVGLEADLQQVFNTHRSQVGDRTLTENEVRAILLETRDSAAAEAAWKGYMEVGRKADAKLRELVRLRNEVARGLGFADYFALRLTLDELEPAALLALMDELDALTRGPFAELKRDLDARRAAHFGIAVEALRPWHYGDLFFQEAPPRPEVDLDALFRTADLPALCRRYYASLGLPVDEILARSDLFERPGKCPHAYCMNMDRQQDLRVLANLKPNLYWANTLLHELGHALYDTHIRPDVPFILRGPPHALMTEGVAEFFGAMAKNGEWLTRVLGADPAQAEALARAARAALREERLIFARWTQVMVRFEQGLYADPDQDLGRLWWQLKQRYQLQNPPETTSRPDYAAKTHILTAPVYYHSYLLGELFAAQVRHHIVHTVLKLDDVHATCLFERPEAGAFLRAHVFGPGSLYPWNELIRRATGEPLTPKYFAAELGAELPAGGPARPTAGG